MKKLMIYTAATVLILGGCTKKILDKDDLSGLGAEIWENESTATLFLNRCYHTMMPAWPSDAGVNVLPYALHNVNDESNTLGQVKILYGTLADNEVTDFGSNPTANTAPYWNIRRVNTLLQEIEKGSLSREFKTRIRSQAYFLRAWNYFNLVKTYGGVPYVTSVQDWITDELAIPRNKTSECIDSLMRDLDSAALAPKELVATQTAGNRGRITRGAAMALKGRVLLHYASAQFNPTNIQDRWLKAYDANRKAYDSLLKDGYALHTNFASVLIDESNANKEVIMIRSYDNAAALPNAFERASKPSSESGGNAYNPTWDLVKAFPMRNGLPITDAASGYDPVYFWKNRDPRFDATIVYNGAVWPIGNNVTRRQWTYTGTPNNPEGTVSTTGFYNRKGVNPATPSSTSNNGSVDWIEIRLAEVMLNLAECANATGKRNEAYEMMTAIRKRAGITAGSNSLYGLKANMTQDEMFSAIIEERRVEFAFENKRYDDLRRTRLWSTLNGKYRTKLTIAVKAPYTTTILNTFIPNSTTVRVRDTINVDGPSYTNFFTVKEENIDAAANPIKFQDNYYFYAIPNTHTSRNINLKQTKGWGAGDFDPLQ